MYLEPRIVGRALDREIERQLQPELRCFVAQAQEILQRAELRMDRIMAALFPAERVRTAGGVRLRRQAVVAALAVLSADRMDGREIQGVETHRPDRRQALDDIVESAVPVRVAALRTREQFIPTGK